MKFPWEKKYLYAGVTLFASAAAILLFYYAIFHMGSLARNLNKIYTVFTPLIFGAAIAYVLNPIMTFMERKIFFNLIEELGGKLTDRIRKVVRMICVILSLLLMILLIYALFAALVPELIRSITNIINNLHTYVSNIQHFAAKLLKNNPELAASSKNILNTMETRLQSWMDTTVTPQLKKFISDFSTQILGLVSFLKNFLIGAMISIYILYGKEKFIAHGKRLLYAFCPNGEMANELIRDVQFVDRTFGGFIFGKIVDSAIIGVLCYIGMSILHLPFTMLISVIVGVTNVIPFFGPYIGAIPSIFLILLINPLQALYFLIFILVLQQIDGNFIGPKILGNSTGMSSFMVIVAILVGGGFFGVAGMFFGVPACAVILAAFKNYLHQRLRKRNYPAALKKYQDIDHLDSQTKKAVYHSENEKKEDTKDSTKFEPFSFFYRSRDIEDKNNSSEDKK